MIGATMRIGSFWSVMSTSFKVSELTRIAIELIAITRPANSGRKTIPSRLNTPAAIGMLITL